MNGRVALLRGRAAAFATARSSRDGHAVAASLCVSSEATGTPSSAAVVLRTIEGAVALRATGPVCANDGLIVTSAAVVDCTVRVGAVEESDVGHKNQIAAIAMIVAATTATRALTYQPGRWTPTLGETGRTMDADGEERVCMAASAFLRARSGRPHHTFSVRPPWARVHHRDHRWRVTLEPRFVTEVVSSLDAPHHCWSVRDPAASGRHRASPGSSSRMPRGSLRGSAGS